MGNLTGGSSGFKGIDLGAKRLFVPFELYVHNGFSLKVNFINSFCWPEGESLSQVFVLLFFIFHANQIIKLAAHGSPHWQFEEDKSSKQLLSKAGIIFYIKAAAGFFPG